MSDEDDDIPETLEDRLRNVKEDDDDQEEEENSAEEEYTKKYSRNPPVKKYQPKNEEYEDEEEDEYEKQLRSKKSTSNKKKQNNPKNYPVKKSPINQPKYPPKTKQTKSIPQKTKKKPIYKEEIPTDELEELTKNKMFDFLKKFSPKDKLSIQNSITKHIEYTLGKTRFDLNNEYIYQGTALSVRDRLLEQWNETQTFYNIKKPKKIHYLSIEFLLGRLLQNSLVCLDLEKNYSEALNDFGIKIEEIYDKELDPALGNGGLGRLAACYIDSMATVNFPSFGYAIRYDYGIFKQVIENCEQKELPDYWLAKGNQWEIMRIDNKFKVRFYGYCKDTWRNGKKCREWKGGEEVYAIAYDTIVPGYKTYNCSTLRLWKSFPSEEFDFEQFNNGEYVSSINEKNMSNFITSVLYPNDNSLSGRELRLKQEYFFSSATVQNIVKDFRKLNLSWNEFPKYNVVQLNDTHPAIASIELLRILIDEYYLEYEEAFNIVKKTFNYTNHTVLPEALEKWGVDTFKKILPRHLELIYLVNFYFMEELKQKYPEKLSKLSIIEESTPKQIRMGNLSVIASTKVNGVAKIHSGIIKTVLFKDFYDLYPEKFTNVTNGVTPRRWIHCAFPELSKLLTEYMNGSTDWLSEMNLLSEIPKKLKNKEKDFMKKYTNAKFQAKIRLKKWVKKNCNITIDENFMYDIMVKRFHEYKRQFMNCLYCIYKYLTIKKMKKDDKKKLNKRVTFFGGKSAPGYVLAKNIIKLINMVSNTVNNDKEVSPYFKIIFLPDYKVSAAQIIIPAADINQQISTAGMEASGTSCMKFVMTGSIILGTRDGANIEIAEEIGENNLFFFGKNVDEVQRIRQNLKNEKGYVDSRLQECFDALYNNEFGDTSFIHDYIKNLANGGDYYMTCHDFYDYVKAQEKVDKEYQNKDLWNKKCVDNICHMGFFSSDRSIRDYGNNIWKIAPCEVPNPYGKEDSNNNVKGDDNEEEESDE